MSLKTLEKQKFKLLKAIFPKIKHKAKNILF